MNFIITVVFLLGSTFYAQEQRRHLAKIHKATLVSYQQDLLELDARRASCK